MSKIKEEVVDMYCPNVFYDTDIYALGEIKTLDEFEKHPLAKKWEIAYNIFKKSASKNHCYFITLFQKKCIDEEQVILYYLTSDDKVISTWNKEGVNVRTYKYENNYLQLIKEYISSREKDRQTTDLTNEAYELSSQLFSFKDLKRTIIEHGKECYIEGYKKHAELFCNFLVKNGYFSKEELDKVLKEFELFQTQGPELSLETAEKFLKTRDIFIFKDNKWYKSPDVELTEDQKDIFNKYTELTNKVNTLRIQKPRQKGITTILKIIAQIEALNSKKVFYAGYGPNDAILNKIKNITYKELHSNQGSLNIELCGKRYDLIIIDEIESFDNPWKTYIDLHTALSENGRIILVGTPCKVNYERMKEFYLTKYSDTTDYKSNVLLTPEEFERLNKYPECINEILGEFLG